MFVVYIAARKVIFLACEVDPHTKREACIKHFVHLHQTQEKAHSTALVVKHVFC